MTESRTDGGTESEENVIKCLEAFILAERGGNFTGNGRGGKQVRRGTGTDTSNGINYSLLSRRIDSSESILPLRERRTRLASKSQIREKYDNLVKESRDNVVRVEISSWL